MWEGACQWVCRYMQSYASVQVSEQVCPRSISACVSVPAGECEGQLACMNVSGSTCDYACRQEQGSVC